MPKVLSYTPEWLSRPNPGHELFTPKQTNGSSIAAKREEPGPRKTIATRGSEIFVAVGHEIRWADLVNLKEGLQPAYRTLKVSVPLPITRLTLSPGEDYLAVSTSHTVHVIHLPDPTLLQDDDSSPIKPKAFQVGPTAHVTEESPVATVLWHTLGYHGRCLVTITKAGVVRLWEVNRADRGSFSEPALSVDLAKLANATSDQDDLSASKFGASKGFSPDSVDLEVASACFGDFPEQEGVHGWAPMTLWIATVPGDVYALCPLLPSKWQLTESTGAFTFLQTLTSSINTNYTELSEDNSASKYEVKTSEKQVAWLSDIIYEEPFLEELPTGDSIKVFARPESAPVVPLLQGPFSISPEVDDFELSDMIVYSLKTLSDGTEEEAAEGIPTAVICLLTDTCKVHVCLDLQGIVGRWLPSPEDDIDDFESDHELIIAETIALVNDDEPSYNQSITPDVHSDFTFFVSHASGVFYISIESWIRELETELSSSQTEGADFRIQRVLESAKSTVEKHLSRKATGNTAAQKVTSSVVIEDGNVGYLLLTTVDNEPFAALLDAPEDGLHSDEDFVAHRNVDGPVNEVREAWQPPPELFESIDLLKSINIPANHRAAMKEEIKLSPSNLELLMNVHRVLSARTHRLQHAVVDLFNRVTRMQDDFRDQVWRTAQVTSKIDAVVGNDDDQSQASGSLYGTAHIEERLDRVRSRQDQLNQRYEKLRNKVSKLSTADLSDKEASFVAELAAMDAAVDSSNTSLSIDEDGTQIPAWKRLEEIKALQDKLAKQVEDATKDAATEGRSRAASVNVPSQSRKVENEMIQEMLERNRVLVEAATQRLRGLGVAIPIEGR